jgi:hypothetical protein
MRFPKTFLRYLGSVPAGSIALGADGAPSGVETNADNFYDTAQRIDRTINRLAIGYAYAGAGPAVAITCDVYQYASDSGLWYRLTPTPFTLTEGALSYVGIVGGQPPQVGQDASLAFYIRPYTAVSAPNGAYTFQVTGDSGVGDPLFGG